jgi:hypothetical protein
LKASIFTKRLTPGGPKRLIRTTGVLPTVSMMLWYFRPMVHFLNIALFATSKIASSNRHAWHCASATLVIGDNRQARKR